MLILLDIGLSFLLGILLIAGYILIEKIRSLKIFLRWHIYQGFKSILEGMIYSLLSVTFILLFKTLNPNTFMPIFVVFVGVLALLRNFTVALFGLISPLIYYAISYDINLQLYLVIVILFMFLIFIQVVKYFFEDWLINFQSIILFLLIAFLVSVIFDFIINHTLTLFTLEIIFIPFLSLSIVYLELQIAIKFLISANILYKSVNFTFSKFYRESLKNDVIGDAIFENKIAFGLYGIFKLSYLELDNKAQNAEVKESILLDLEKVFPTSTIFFSANDNHYGFFYALESKDQAIKLKVDLKKSLAGNAMVNRDSDDVLKFLEQILKLWSLTYLTSWNERINVKIKAGVALYGVQSNSLVELHDFADFALNNLQSLQKNHVQLFSPSDYFQILKSENLLNQMDNHISLDNFVSKLVPMFNYHQKQLEMFLLSTDKIDYSDLKESVRSLVNFFGWDDIFDRHMAYWALNNYELLNLEQNLKMKLAFFYSPKILGQSFNLASFENRIKKFGVSLTNIVLIFDPYAFLQMPNQVIFFQNLDNLTTLGVKFGIIKPNQFKTTDLLKINPDYYFITNDQELEHDISIKQLLPQIQIIQTNEQQGQNLKNIIDIWPIFGFDKQQLLKYLGSKNKAKLDFIWKLKATNLVKD